MYVASVVFLLRCLKLIFELSFTKILVEQPLATDSKKSVPPISEGSLSTFSKFAFRCIDWNDSK